MSKSYARHSRSQKSVAIRVVLPIVIREVRRRAGARVVELGCGPGTLLRELGELGCRALGLDADALAVALARNAKLSARHADFRRIPAALRARFDVAYSNEALHWTPMPPARFRRASWNHRFLPAGQAGAFERWGKARFIEGLRGVARLLAPGGVAVLQFGARGQIQELFEAFDEALEHPRLARHSGRLWYPTYYPHPRRVRRLLSRAGLSAQKLRSWSEPLAETSVKEAVSFVRAFTERGFLARLTPGERTLFYSRLSARLARTGLRKVRWRRCLVVAGARRAR